MSEGECTEASSLSPLALHTWHCIYCHGLRDRGDQHGLRVVTASSKEKLTILCTSYYLYLPLPPDKSSKAANNIVVAPPAEATNSIISS